MSSNTQSNSNQHSDGHERLHSLLSDLGSFDGQLCDLHTHLLGMGNAEFWVHGILFDSHKLPTDSRFKADRSLRTLNGPLVWVRSKQAFMPPDAAADFFQDVRQFGTQAHMRSANMLTDMRKNFLKREGLNYRDVLDKSEWNALFPAEGFCDQMHLLHSSNLSFETHFCYDVVLQLEHLIDAFGLPRNKPTDLLQAALEDRLGVGRDISSLKGYRGFQRWIIFNARNQCFEIVKGLRCEDLRLLCGGFVAPDEARNPMRQDALSHVLNCFSMNNADGSQPRNIDFHIFRGNFTPEFYPRRYSLKDSLYGQRLDLLAFLLQHVLKRYDSCMPAVRYVEFSLGVGDLSRPWVLDVLLSYQPKNAQPLKVDDDELLKWTNPPKGKLKTLSLGSNGDQTSPNSPSSGTIAVTVVAQSDDHSDPAVSSPGPISTFRRLLEASIVSSGLKPFPWLAKNSCS